MNIHPIPLHMFYAKLLQRLGVRQIYVFDIPLHDLNV
jgi:hypothetical protein